MQGERERENADRIKTEKVEQNIENLLTDGNFACIIKI
jgi:hypothetical protein